MLNDSRVVFPDGIGALIVESDERFLRSAALMLSLLNYRGTVAFFPCFPLQICFTCLLCLCLSSCYLSLFRTISKKKVFPSTYMDRSSSLISSAIYVMLLLWYSIHASLVVLVLSLDLKADHLLDQVSLLRFRFPFMGKYDLPLFFSKRVFVWWNSNQNRARSLFRAIFLNILPLPFQEFSRHFSFAVTCLRKLLSYYCSFYYYSLVKFSMFVPTLTFMQYIMLRVIHPLTCL